MSRLGLIKENVVLSSDEAFVLCDSNGTEQVRLLVMVDLLLHIKQYEIKMEANLSAL